MERFETMCVSGDGVEKDMHNARIIRLRKQIEDQVMLRKAFDRRDSEVDKQVQSVLSEQRLSQWRYVTLLCSTPILYMVFLAF